MERGAAAAAIRVTNESFSEWSGYGPPLERNADDDVDADYEGLN